jgi:hypothetical protein
LQALIEFEFGFEFSRDGFQARKQLKRPARYR